MSRSAVLALKITGDATGAKRALTDADDAAGGFGRKLGAVAGIAAGAIGVVGAVGKAAFDSASNLEQQVGAVDAVFGKAAGRMHGYAEQAAQTVGLATADYSQLASVLGSQLSNAGFAGDKLTGTTDDLIKKGADLAAQFGGSTADAVQALSSVLKGETDPIEKYGVSIKQSDINAKLAASGQDKLTGAALKSATAAAALSLVTDQTKNSQGAFARESDTAAGKMATLSAMWENGKAKLGEGLLPVFVKVADFVTGTIVPAWQSFSAEGGTLSTIMGVVSGFISESVVPVFKDLWGFLVKNVVPIWETLAGFIVDIVLPAFNGIWGFISDYIIPIFKTVLTPILKGVSDVFKIVADKINDNKDKFEKFFNALKPLFDWLKNTFAPFIASVLEPIFDTIGTVIGAVIDSIAWILDKGSGVIEWLTGGGGVSDGGKAAKSGAPMVGAAAGSVAGFGAMSGGPAALVAAAASSGPQTVVHITVEGALDPVAVGRQIDGLVRRYAQTSGRAPALALGGLR